MSYYTCAGGPFFTDWKKAGWCQIHMEMSEKEPYALRTHYTLWNWLVLLGPHDPPDEDPSYYTVEPLKNCAEGTEFNSWYKDNYADAFECQNALTRINGECYEARFIEANWFGYRYYRIIRTGRPAERRSYCEFMLRRAKVDKILWP